MTGLGGPLRDVSLSHQMARHPTDPAVKYNAALDRYKLYSHFLDVKCRICSDADTYVCRLDQHLNGVWKETSPG